MRFPYALFKSRGLVVLIAVAAIVLGSLIVLQMGSVATRTSAASSQQGLCHYGGGGHQLEPAGSFD